MSGEQREWNRGLRTLLDCVTTSGTGHPEIVQRVITLSDAYTARHRATGDVEWLDRAIGWLERIRPRASGADLGVLLVRLGDVLDDRFTLGEDPDDLNRAIAAFTEGLAEPEAFDPDADQVFRRLLFERFLREQELDDLDEFLGISHARLAAVPGDAPGRPELLYSIGRARLERYLLVGHPVDLESAVFDVGRSVADGPVTPEWWGRLAQALHEQWLRTGSADVLDRAVRAGERSIAVAPDAGAAREAGRNFASVLHARYDARGDHRDLDRAVELLRSYLDAIDQSDPDWPDAVSDIGVLLERRGDRHGSGDDHEASLRLHEAASRRYSAGHLPAAARWTATTARAEQLVGRYLRGGDESALRDAVDLLSDELADLPITHGTYPALATLLVGALELTHRIDGGDPRAMLELARTITEVLAPSDHRRADALHNHARLLASSSSGTGDHDGAALHEVISLLEEAYQATTADGPERARRATDLGELHLRSYDGSGDPAALRRAGVLLREAVELTDAAFWTPYAGRSRTGLAEVLRRDGQPDAARDQARRGLETRLLGVLLATDADDGVSAAGAAGADAITLAHWCLNDGRPDDAVEALEQGRALTLHSATSAALLPGLLRSGGHGELARRWVEHGGLAGAGEPAGVHVPESVRYEVVRVLLEPSDPVSASQALMTPPAVPAIAGALRAIGADALVYLVAGSSETGPGHALVVQQTAAGTDVVLPELVIGGSGPEAGPLQRYVEAYTEAFVQSHQDREAHKRWRRALRELSDHLSDAVERILQVVSAGAVSGRDVPHLVLVPVGGLAHVPWQAVRLPSRSGAGSPYLVERAVISYVPSARMLVDVADRAPSPGTTGGLLVGDPTDDLPHALVEVAELQSSFYPDANVFGSGASEAAPAAFPEHVLAAMPSADGPGLPLLHLACHGEADVGAERSLLRLADSTVLTAQRLLAHSAGRSTEAAGPLVVLSACETTVARGLIDEALSLTACFIAAGASSAIGALWPVADERAAEIMRDLHRYLAEGQPPAVALRSAQLAMLGVGESTGIRARMSRVRDPYWWAGFVHQGR